MVRTKGDLLRRVMESTSLAHPPPQSSNRCQESRSRHGPRMVPGLYRPYPAAYTAGVGRPRPQMEHETAPHAARGSHKEEHT